ncbi:copper resistance CopC/CopD family protein [Paenibacillus sedimenti]|uniref:Copper resistance protein CopC/CopD n=1 Tax=Paenibacillus sedimenti TaxID=2770274 RepID=A0A926QJ54_9BACL|nr:copper resistance protein CopC [Paenibacillus sedimenti]MBD0380037.1 copper resistance protein CopC/CopD [Paenibacillus sedimenti]
MRLNRGFKCIRLRPAVLLFMLAAAMICSVIAPQQASAHASLVQATPEADSKLQESPAAVTITFNERLDEGLYYIKVFDHTGDEVTRNKAQMNAEQTGIELKLPKLQEGVYLISYHVISADGHPVGGSYPITIGNPPQEDALDLPRASISHQHGGAGPLSTKEMLQYAFRGAWYLMVLALAGWVCWLRLPGHNGAEVRKSLASWTLNIQRAQLLALLLLIFTHIEDLLGGGGAEEIWKLFSATNVGISWLLLLALSFIGFVLVGRFVWLDILWALCLLAAKSFSGHAASFSPAGVTVGLDFIHLAAAALWVGGLVLLMVKWSQHQEIGSFMRTFSNMALISILVLTITGSVSVLIFLPNLKYLLYGSWGIVLLLKIGAVLLVVVIGFVLRTFIRKKKEQQSHLWLKIDLTFMVIIMLLVGILTYVAPIPANTPLTWHQMGEKVHVSADITPKVQGTNTFVAKVWLPEQAGTPKQVLMILRYQDDEEIAPISVPIVPFEDKTQEESYGFKKYSYKVSGAYLPFRGNWDLEMRVMDKEDNETVYHKTFIVY